MNLFTLVENKKLALPPQFFLHHALYYAVIPHKSAKTPPYTSTTQ